MTDKQKTSLRGEALRNKVLQCALKLFSEKGFFNTSVHDIQREANVSIGAIYHHFDNKEALAKALYEAQLQLMDEAIAEVSADQQGCLKKSRAIIQKMFELTMKQPKSMQFVLLAQHREYLPDETPICSSQPFQTMKNVIVQGMYDGEVRKMEPWVAATAMFGGALRMMNLQLDGVLDKSLFDYLDEVMDCAWRSIKN